MWRETHVRAMINKNVPRVASADAAYFCFGRWAGTGEGWGARNKRQTASEPLSPLIIGNIVERGVNAVGHSLSSCADLFCWVSQDSLYCCEGKKEG